MELNNQLPACKKCRRRVCSRESNKQQKYLTTAFMNMVSYNKVRRKACFQAFAYYYHPKFSNTKLLYILANTKHLFVYFYKIFNILNYLYDIQITFTPIKIQIFLTPIILVLNGLKQSKTTIFLKIKKEKCSKTNVFKHFS